MRSSVVSIIIAIAIILAIGGGGYLVYKKFIVSADVATTPKSADLNGDNKVNALDTNIMIRVISEGSTNQKYDLNNDGRVDNLDMKVITSQWSK